MLASGDTLEACLMCGHAVEACTCGPLGRRDIGDLICGAERHAKIKADPRRWATETSPGGHQADENGEHRWEVRHCTACGSTLYREVA